MQPRRQVNRELVTPQQMEQHRQDCDRVARRLRTGHQRHWICEHTPQHLDRPRQMVAGMPVATLGSLNGGDDWQAQTVLNQWDPEHLGALMYLLAAKAAPPF